MSSDMDDILQIFFQECDEQLQELERGLSALSDGESEHETVNAVFRAVHSIKGGAASFGLDNLVRFAHVFENSLDGLRSGRFAPTHDVVKVFLKAMDVLSDLVNEARGGATVDSARVAESHAELANISGTGGNQNASQAATTEDVIPADFSPVPMDFEPVPTDFEPVPFDFDFGEEEATPAAASLLVTFRPHDALYERGDDARNILIGLTDLARECDGEILTTCDRSALPPLTDLLPDKSYLSWQVVLPPAVSEDSANAVFDWVSEDCDFSIVREGAEAAAPQEPPVEQPEPAEVVAVMPPVEDHEAPPPAPAPSVAHPIQILSPLPAPATPDAHPGPSPAGSAASSTANGAAQTAARKPEQASIRVDLHRIDDLMDLVGELVIAQAAIESLSRRTDAAGQHELVQSISSMQSLTRDIQDAVMAVRAQPVRAVFQRMQRVVREASSMTHKDIVLTLEGEDTEVDRTLVEKLTDPLTHMLRNAVDHGIESPEARIAAGKPAEGHIVLSAEHRSGRILITIKDDGAGINRQRVFETAVKRGVIPADAVLSDEEINNLIFMPGFSTAAQVSNLSGRGVGMDVVKQAIQSLGGRISISSVPGKGTTFGFSLPLTLAILDGMLISASGSTMVIPISSVIETMIVNQSDVYALPDGSNVISIRGDCMPLIPLATVLKLSNSSTPDSLDASVILVVENESGARAALIVDEIRDQTQVVIKSIESNYRQIFGVSAATILGDGSVSLILDVSALVASAIGHIDIKPSNIRAELAA
ncbi:chemotaxis protein CheA [Gluconacetobacter sp. 1c LMG 22058]|uniref:Chemotaxis protein CheA n=1 Tax=Gluconacetobacter dulcium TaxID=2729096 RepID=A0A7W4JZ81_9PROT|nr:chemotaxis protein CheA [Gluconacetobacter dulcium]MBB2197448.1 chemotaxis protein CheA [Gluconacetobacter dulcium]